MLRFGTAGKEVQGKKAETDCLDYLRQKEFLKTRPHVPSNYEFRISPGLIDIPDTQEILNSLMGIPVQIAGGSTVFFGGLQRSHHDSLVMSVSGSPGSGKTSLALALAASLAPFGTRCLYCTFEEDAQTLERRAVGIVPHYFPRTSLPNSTGTEWLCPINLDPRLVKDVKGFSSRYISHLKEEINKVFASNSKIESKLPGIAPVLVVIDSLTTILGRNGGDTLNDFCTLVGYLRSLNCIVLLLSAEGIPHDSRLEYLVDTVVNLRHEGTRAEDRKPCRLFQLIKSRLQMSRPGSHILHLSGERGVRVSPQLPSQLDSHKIHRTPLADTLCIIDTLRIDCPVSKNNLRKSEAHRRIHCSDRLIDLYPRSRILIHGRGSAGKAPFALKLLMSQEINAENGKKKLLAPHRRNRILVVSFLYPKEYYEGTLRKLAKIALKNGNSGETPDMRVIALTPGYIGPEDFVGRILLEMDRGYLEGNPYTSVLLDGLHNIFLQFPTLQKNHMVWAALYSLLSRHDLTIVTTFTTFVTTHPTHPGQNKEDEEILLQGQLPFLHLLVQGADFILRVEAHDVVHHDRKFPVTVEGAIKQRIPVRALTWNADEFTFDGFEVVKEPGSQLKLGF